jgi:hypothetical protein
MGRLAMVHLRARVWRATGNTTHLVGSVTKDRLEVDKIPDPKAIELVQRDGACYLLRLDSAGICISDTWHETIEAAKAQAEFEFGIGESEWMEP